MTTKENSSSLALAGVGGLLASVGGVGLLGAFTLTASQLASPHAIALGTVFGLSLPVALALGGALLLAVGILFTMQGLERPSKPLSLGAFISQLRM